ncbi:MAG: DUF3300 domain-containing protein [Woeseiaceae bacterium]|nr:DUF3300 domain-containing protein [Woeseiaceae bacterium]
MNNRLFARRGLASLVLAFSMVPLAACAQVPVDEHGEVVGDYQPADEVAPERPLGNEEIPLMSQAELEELVGPIALYPDDLLAVVLPAAAYPLQIMEAARFLEELEDDASLKPDPDWDDSVVALLNYPEVVKLLNDDIDWTWRLGEAVIAQQQDVVGAIQSFRDRAYAAGNLKSDDYQSVSQDEGVIEITPVSDDVIYVPYYEPERVVVYQPRPVYYYYPRRYPVYYYPYPSSYAFDRGYFWGVTTAFTIGWVSDSLHVYHHSYYGHPYFGRSYWSDRWWYRRPNINVYNTSYVRNRNVTINRYYHGDIWRPRPNRRDYVPQDAPRIATSRHYPSGRSVETRQRTEDRSQLEGRRTNARNEVDRRNAEIRNDLVRRQPTQARRENTIREQLAEARRSSETRRQQPQLRRQAEPRAEARTEPGARNAAERRESILRQLRARDDADARHRSETRRGVTARREPQRDVIKREQAVRQVQPQRQARTEPVVRQSRTERQVKREPTVRQVQPQRQVRSEPAVRQPQAQRQVRAPSRSQAKRAEPQRSQPRQKQRDSRERTRRSDR